MAPNSNKLLFWFQRTEIKIVGKLAKIKRSVLRVGARLADISCSAVPTPLLYSLVDTNISLWTRTNATCTLCVCVWMCVCSALLFKWFKLMFLVHVAAFSVNDWSDRLFELSESVSCAIRASPLLLSCSRPNHLCPYRTTMSFDFQLRISHISSRSLTNRGPSCRWRASRRFSWRECFNIMKREKTEADWSSLNSRCFAFPGHSSSLLHSCCTKQFNVGESSPSIMCTNATLIFETLFQRVFVWKLLCSWWLLMLRGQPAVSNLL